MQSIRNVAAAILLLSTPLHALETFAQMDLSYQAPEGVGYEEGYASADLLLAAYCGEGPLLFFNPRGHLFDDGSTAANAGFGLRCGAGDCNQLGANIYYDFRGMPKDLRTDFHTTFHQIGFGLEFLSRCFSLHFNTYTPLGRKKVLSQEMFTHFAGHNAFSTQRGAAALSSIEGLVGFPLRGLFDPIDFYITTGSYYLFERTNGGHRFGKALGVKAEIEAALSNWLRLAISTSHDRIFDTRVQATASITFALGGRDSSGCCWSALSQEKRCRDNRLKRPRREEIIPLQKKRFKGIVYCKPGMPAHFVFVDNSNMADGNGTFESPFSSLANAETNSSPNAILYIFPGDGSDNNMDSGITLQDGQRLIGSGFSLLINGVFIPAQTPGSYPHITNNGGIGVLLATAGSNQVAGLLIDDADQGIKGTGDGSLYCINDNFIEALNDAICLDLANSTAFVQGNDLRSGGPTSVEITSNQSSVVFENNVMGAKFKMSVSAATEGPSILRATGNIRLFVFDPTFDLPNSSDPSNFLVEVEDPANGVASFENANQGTVNIPVNDVTFVPLFSEIAENNCNFCN